MLSFSLIRASDFARSICNFEFPFEFVDFMASEKALRTRSALIDAANKIIREEGIESLTMDNVAAAAGVSKGACMYHFKTKRELTAALLENYARHLDEMLKKHEALFEGTPEDTLVPGYIEWFRTFDRDNHGWASVGTALLSQYSADEELMKPVRSWYENLYKRIEALPDEKRIPTVIAIMMLEGFFYSNKFGLDFRSPKTKHDLWNYVTTKLISGNARHKRR